MEVKSSGTAMVLSFLWTGLGQLYAGRVGRGLLMMAATPVIWGIAWLGGGMSAFFGGGTALIAVDGAATRGEMATGGTMTLVGVVLLLGGFTWWIWGIVNARTLCVAFNASQLRPASGIKE